MAKRFHDGAYAGHGARVAQEGQDSSMIREDRSAVANLPQDVKYTAWATGASYLNANLNDTITGIDKQKSEDVSGTKSHLQNNKW